MRGASPPAVGGGAVLNWTIKVSSGLLRPQMMVWNSVCRVSRDFQEEGFPPPIPTKRCARASRQMTLATSKTMADPQGPLLLMRRTGTGRSTPR
jgi:hypothetical protein